MTSDRKKPSVAFWTTVVMVVGLVYVASFGPAYWFLDYCDNPEWACFAVGCFYSPILYLASVAPEPIRDVITWYGDF